MISNTIAMLLSALPAQVEGAPAPATPGGGMPQMLVMIAGFIGIMYFFMIRPQQKQAAERRAMLAAIGKGDRVVTTGGICGTVIGLNDSHVVLCVDEKNNTKIEFVRSAVDSILKKDGEGK